MEGKEARFGIVNSAIWATATTAASNGSVNSMHDSYMPLGWIDSDVAYAIRRSNFWRSGFRSLWHDCFCNYRCFYFRAYDGRTPEYLGKKIESYEMKMASLMILIPPILVLVGTAIAVIVPQGKAAILNPGASRFQ